jgi:excisionase family DNA binding protein
MTDQDDLLLIEEVAAICRASPSTVRFWIKTGKLRSIRPGRRRLIARSELRRLLSGRRPGRARPAKGAT